jgi:hypothetical protein
MRHATEILLVGQELGYFEEPCFLNWNEQGFTLVLKMSGKMILGAGWVGSNYQAEICETDEYYSEDTRANLKRLDPKWKDGVAMPKS